MLDETLVAAIHERYLSVQARIATAARAVGREPGSVQLVVVTKSQPLPVLQAALAAGVRIFGENYPEEAVTKIQDLGAENKVEWHMIGHVQSRKARLVAEHFALLHSLDSLKLARRLDRFSAETGRRLPVLLEFNVGGEESKFGWPARDVARWADLLPEIDQLLGLAHLDVRGVMTMPPFFTDAELSRPYFRRLRQLRDYLSVQFPQAAWQELSMGTSVDFQVAVQEGATLVRVGQAIVGPRPA